MPSRSRHSRNHNNHSNRSSNKNRNRRDNQSTQSTSDKSSHHSRNTDSKCTTSKKHNHSNNNNNNNNSSTHQSIDEKSEHKSISIPSTFNKLLIQSSMESSDKNHVPLSDIKEFENDIILEFKTCNLSISDLLLLLEKYCHRRNANALFLFGIICDFIIGNNLYLFEMECNDKIRNIFFKVLFGLTNKITFKNVINQNSWALSIIKLLQCGLPTLSSSLIHWMAKHIRIHNGNNNTFAMDQLRFIIMFLRPEIVEQSAELVQFNASIFEEVFRELINALSDNYQPFRIWLFHRLCSKKRNSRLIEPQLAQFICFGDKKLNTNSTKKVTKSRRAKSLIINMSDEDEKSSDNQMDLGRLMNAFKFCMDASNQLVINNQTRTYYELGHLILNDVISIASTLRCHFSLDDSEFCRMIAIMHCNLGSIYLHQNKYNLALISANKALEFDVNCLQSHRIRAEYYIKYRHDINKGLNELYEILSKDCDHPYAINMKKEIIKNNKLSSNNNNNIYISKQIKNKSNINIPAPREKHSAVNYRNDKLIIYGGCSINNNNENESENETESESLNDLWILDVNNNRWMQLDITGNVIPCKRHSHTANIISNKLYIIGGANRNINRNVNRNNIFDSVHNRIKKKIYNKINSDYYHFERNRNKRQLKMHHFSTYKNIKNPKERVFSLNSTNSNGVTLETVVTFKDKDKEKEKKNNNSNKGYALGGWFTNFFKHENDEKIKELAAKGIISDENISSDNDIIVNGNDTDSISMSSENSNSNSESECNSESISEYDMETNEEESIEHYEINTFPAIEMLDLKHNKWIRPETTGTSPKNILINHRSIVVGKKIFIFPTNYSYPYVYNNIEEVSCGYVLFTDTLHWESFEIPKSHKIILNEQIIPVLYDKKDKIMFVSMFDNKYHIHCLLFTKSPMEWSPIKKLPTMNKLSGYNRLTHFAYTSVNNNYIVVHGGVLNNNGKDKLSDVEHINLLSKLPMDGDIMGNVIDGTRKEYNNNNIWDIYDEYDEYDSYSYDENDSEYDNNNRELQPLYCINNGNNHESRVSIVESLLFNKNPSEIHRIGPIKKDNNEMENDIDNDAVNDNDMAMERGEEYGHSNGNNNNKIKTKISYKTTTRTIATKMNTTKYKTMRTRTITTTHHHAIPNIPSPIDTLNTLKKKLLLTKRDMNIKTMHLDEELFYNMKYCDINKYKNKYSFLSNFEIFDFVSMRWLPRISITCNNKIYNNHFIEGSEVNDNLLEIPRINHTITMVGNNLCIFGGVENSNVLIIENFIKNTDKLNKKFYKNYDVISSNDSSDCRDSNALSLTKYLFGISPNIFSNGSYRMVQCANCLILECNRFNFRTCSGCAQVQYCSKLCQKNHWKLNHRHFCTKNHIRYQ